MARGTYLGASGVAFKGSRPREVEDQEEVGIEGEGHTLAENHGEDREEDEGERVLMGLDFLTSVRGLEISGEAVWLSSSATEPAQRGAFLQGVIPLVGNVYGVLLGEVFDPVDEASLWSCSLGATWRVHRRLVLKLDRQITDRPSARVPDGWFFSISSLF